MEKQEISKERGALLFIAQTLDKGLSNGAYNREDVLNYNQALIILEDVVKGLEEPSEEE